MFSVYAEVKTRLAKDLRETRDELGQGQKAAESNALLSKRGALEMELATLHDVQKVTEKNIGVRIAGGFKCQVIRSFGITFEKSSF